MVAGELMWGSWTTGVGAREWEQRELIWSSWTTGRGSKGVGGATAVYAAAVNN